MNQTLPNWMVSIFRSAFPELAAMSDDELAQRIAALEQDRDDIACVLRADSVARHREQAGKESEFPF